jgi:hypothetical protein
VSGVDVVSLLKDKLDDDIILRFPIVMLDTVCKLQAFQKALTERPCIHSVQPNSLLHFSSKIVKKKIEEEEEDDEKGE